MKKSNLKNYMLLVIIFSLFFSYIIVIGYSNEIGIKDGMFVKHTYTKRSFLQSGTWPSKIIYSNTSDEIFHVEWEYSGFIGSWDVNISTRIVSNSYYNDDNVWVPSNGTYDWSWIYIDVSLNDQIPIHRALGGTIIFTITDEANYGSMEVWQLEDDYGSVAWYEKSSGFLVNGTFVWAGNWYEIFEFEGINSGNGAIPGFNCIFLIGLLLVSAIVMLKKISIRKRLFVSY